MEYWQNIYSNFDPVAFSLGSISVHWYGIMYALALLSAIMIAKWFIKNVPRLRGGMPPVLDLEWNPFSPTCVLRPPAKEVRRVATRFINIIERHYQTRVVVYTAPDFWERNNVARLKRDFWLRSTAQHVEKRYGVKGWQFWQYTATGVLDGIEKEVDFNCFNGGKGQWNKWRKARAVR